ncbi:hypothetical protein EDM56_27350 [Brevibacillus fluminis]|uniref:VCBS repeat-containing protein n=1 Tax=Brevibacillus fluminis TaxID=511487 RepID=A0A3M8CXT8_9BACL|nr:hypothetical protein [Brevibacillus fluminis]RNB80131.1 hypothetical protein EDM56_27350 [Brevibacillus fluminis]
MNRNRLIVAITTVLLLCSQTFLPTIYADPQPHGPAPVVGFVLSEQQADVTGDQTADTVTLIGNKKNPQDVYNPSFTIMVYNPPVKGYTFFTTTDGGYNPRMQFYDFTGDKVAEIFLSASTGGSSGVSTFHLYSARANQPKELPTPPPLTLSGQFLDNYKVKINVAEQNKAYTIDVSNRKQQYDNLGIYQNGRLVKPTPIMTNDYAELRPVDINNDGIYDLQGFQRVSGAFNADTLGYVISIWKWDRAQNKWALMNTTFQPQQP